MRQLESQSIKILKPMLCQSIKDRVTKYNKNCLIIFVGETGSGKSYAALRMAEIIDPDFDISRVHFDTEAFLTNVNNGRLDGTLKKGSVIIYDEIGVGHSSRNFYDSVNKALNFVFQSFRKDNFVVFMTAPKLKFIDIQVRELAHQLIVPYKLDKEYNLLWCNSYMITKNELMGKTYLIKPLVASDAGITKLSRFGVGLPSEKLRMEYEHKKKIFLDCLYQEAIAKARISKVMTNMSLGIGDPKISANFTKANNTDSPLFNKKTRRFMKFAGKINTQLDRNYNRPE